MDSFENVISAILIDMIKAQNRANEYSASLVPYYRDPEKAPTPKDPNLVFFPVPNSVIKSFDVKLSFAVEDIYQLQDVALANSVYQTIKDILISDANIDIEKEDSLALQCKSLAAKIVLEYRLFLISDRNNNEKFISNFCNTVIHQLTPLKEKAPEIKNNVQGALLKQLTAMLPLHNTGAGRGLLIKYQVPEAEDEKDKSGITLNFNVDMRSYDLGFTDGPNDDPNQRKHFLISN